MPSDFQNAVYSHNGTTDNLHSLFETIRVSTVDQMCFAINADQLVDHRNLQAHYYHGVGLREAVAETQGMFASHAGLSTEHHLIFCKRILDAFPTFSTNSRLKTLFPDN